MKIRPKNSVQPVSFASLPDDALLRARQLLIGASSDSGTAVLPFSRATLFRLVRAQSFPAPRRISHGVTAWQVGDVRRWLEAQQIGGAV
jgi:prophage regulatory protein